MLDSSEAGHAADILMGRRAIGASKRVSVCQDNFEMPTNLVRGKQRRLAAGAKLVGYKVGLNVQGDAALVQIMSRTTDISWIK